MQRRRFLTRNSSGDEIPERDVTYIILAALQIQDRSSKSRSVASLNQSQTQLTPRNILLSNASHSCYTFTKNPFRNLSLWVRLIIHFPCFWHKLLSRL